MKKIIFDQTDARLKNLLDLKSKGNTLFTKLIAIAVAYR